MPFNNNPKPALAYAGCPQKKSVASQKNEFAAFASAREADYSSDYSASGRKGGSPHTSSYIQKKRKLNALPFVFALIAIVAVIIVIAIIVAIVNAPGSNMKMSDTLFFTYKDSDGVSHIIIDDEIQEDITFTNDIELVPATNNSFAYIFESDASGGKKMHILSDDGDLDSSDRIATEIVKYSSLKPCVVYKIKASADNVSTYCYKGDRDDILISNSTELDNFIIADDASVVYFTNGANTPVTKFENSNYIEVPPFNGLVPVAISPNGDYLYGVRSNTLYCIDTTDTDENDAHPYNSVAEGIVNFIGITAMNADGDQIVFATSSASGSITSYFYDAGDNETTALGAGLFTSVHPDPVVIYEDSLLDSYFTIENTFAPSVDAEDEDEDEDEGNGNTASSYSTVFVNRKKEVKTLATTTGKFSPDGKYFYYINQTNTENTLKRIPLSSKDFDKHENISASNGIAEFFITQKGDIYMACKEAANEAGKITINFCEASAQKAISISSVADEGSISIAVNTLYYSSTATDSETGAASTSVYASTSGSDPDLADFDEITPTQAPIIKMGSHKNGYSYITYDKDGISETKLFYTSGGKSFEFITNCYLSTPSTAN